MKLINNLFYVGVLLPMFIIIFRTPPRFRENRLLLLIAGVLFYFAFSTFWGDQPYVEKWGQSLRHIVYILLYIAAVSMVFQRDRWFWSVVKFISITAGVGLTINLYFFVSGNKDRMYGVVSYENAVDLGVAYGFASILLLSAIIECKFLKRWSIPLLIYLIVGMMLTETRTALIGFCLASVVILIKNMRIKHMLVCVSAMVVILIVAWQFGLLERFHLPSLNSDRPIPRFLVWHEIWQEVKDQGALLSGIGYHSRIGVTVVELRETFSTTHSLYVGSFMLGGILGLSLVLCVVLYTYWLGIRQSYSGGSWFTLGLLVYGTFCGLTHGTRILGHPGDNWLFWWFPVALVMPPLLQYTMKDVLNKSREQVVE
ncbi:O-antigen ligase [Hahella sp. CCB-MM4]|uniref:O-antigen ligase family protein n=1 Tax=Hahella sp. (strain CCB-MM4) TaxID=1926491 RepID=UPI0011406736|nr:O-antigen ligase family protein [Hahella sp. CCB-MM4]